MTDNLQQLTDRFFKRQLASWSEAGSRYRLLGQTVTKTVKTEGMTVTVQYNPARIVSSGARTDAASIRKRPCFLCDCNRPPQQESIDLGDFKILVNPFPILPYHLTISSATHRDQLISGNIGTMMDLASRLDRMILFYNGPRCGASAPDHLHFQAVERGSLPLVETIENGMRPPFGIIVIDRGDISRFEETIKRLPRQPEDPEPKINLLCYKSETSGCIRTVIIPRRSHRPEFYGTGEGQLLVSPASVDLAGVFVAPRRQDFDAIDSRLLHSIYDQLCFTQQQTDEFIR